MPEAFLRCVAAKGSKVRTLKLKGNKFMRICIDKSGKTHNGEVKTKKDGGDG